MRTTFAAAVALVAAIGAAQAETRTVYGLCTTFRGNMTCEVMPEWMGDYGKKSCMDGARITAGFTGIIGWKRECLTREVEIPTWHEAR
jgi:hypothetical protein